METPESILASLRKGEWVTSIDLTDAYLHVPIHTQSQKYLRFHFQGVTYQFTSLPFGLATAPPPHFHQYSQGSKTDSPTIRNQAPPIAGRLVNPCPLKTGMHGVNPKTAKAGERSCEANARQVDKASGDVPSPLHEVCYQCKDSYVHHWLTSINGEDCKIGQDAYETFSVASQNSSEIYDASGHTDPLESEDDTTRGMVVRPSKCAKRRISPPQGTRKTNLRSKFYRRGLVSNREASSHQPIRTEGGSPGSAILQKGLHKQSSPYPLRQHLGGGLHQQTGWHKISRTLCSNVENPHLVSPKQCHTQSETRTRFTQ